MRSPSHRLGTVPAGEGIGRETRVDECEVGSVEDMVEVVIIVVDLWWRELALVDNVLGGKGTDVETLGESTIKRIAGQTRRVSL